MEQNVVGHSVMILAPSFIVYIDTYQRVLHCQYHHCCKIIMFHLDNNRNTENSEITKCVLLCNDSFNVAYGGRGHLSYDAGWDHVRTLDVLKQHNSITCIRSYATHAHGHKLYIQIHNTVINWKNPTYTYMSKQTEKHYKYRQIEILRKQLIIHLNRFDYLQLHFCVQNFLSETAHVFKGNYIVCSKKFYKFIHRWSSIVISRYILRSQVEHCICELWE